jgi:hypothetical protein
MDERFLDRGYNRLDGGWLEKARLLHRCMESSPNPCAARLVTAMSSKSGSSRWYSSELTITAGRRFAAV